MRIQMPEYVARYPHLGEAITMANRLLEGQGDFLNQVRALPEFALSEHVDTHQPVTGAEIAPLLAQQIDVVVERYTPWYVCSKATASTTPGSTVIRLNARKLNRPTEDLVATLIHECVHIVDRVPGMMFGHGNNYAHGKEQTAPYRIEAVARAIVIAMNPH